MNSTLKRKKSIASHAASISAWCGGLRLAEHRRGVQRVAPRPGEQLGGAQDDAGALLPRPARPVLPRLARRIDRLLHVLGAALMDVGENVLLVVRHHGRASVSPVVTSLPPITSGISRRSLRICSSRSCRRARSGAAGRVVVDRLVVPGGGAEDRVGAHAPYITAVDLSHVLWIGGGQGSGKTSVARALVPAVRSRSSTTSIGEPGCTSRGCRRTEFGSLSMDERWLHATPAQMLDWFVTNSRHRFRLVLEDLAALPASPLAIVEGPQLFPTSVAAVLREADHALFLIPDLDEQRERLRARGPIPGDLGRPPRASERDGA